MRLVKPKFWILNDGQGDTGGMVAYLVSRGIAWRPDPDVTFSENMFEFAGRLCYESWELEDGTFENKNITKIRKGNGNYLGNIIKQKHLAVFEHNGPITILFSDVSRVFTHEQVRHRAGCAYSQTSGRYVRGDDVTFQIPEILQPVEHVLQDTVKLIESQYKKMSLVLDIDRLTRPEDFPIKKELTSALRRILPNGQCNNLLMSTNHRALRHMLVLRSASGAEAEIRNIYTELGHWLVKTFPNIYQDFRFDDDPKNGGWKADYFE